MTFHIVGDQDRNRIHCMGSFTKLLTTYVCLCFLAEQYSIIDIIDDANFFDKIVTQNEAKKFLQLFKQHIGGDFSLHDVCSYYTGLPYTFSLTEAELESVDTGQPFKHHSILDENIFLKMCSENIIPIYTDQCKFHYSELAIIFLGYFIEKNYSLKIEDLYRKYILDKFSLKNSLFSRVRIGRAYCRDFSDKYDYPSIAILDHGYFSYSNGFYTTLNDMKNLLEHLFQESVFHFMLDTRLARAASGTIMNGLTVEIRFAQDDILYGYEGLSFSGCNIWAYSSQRKAGYLTFIDDEEAAYEVIYTQQLGVTKFDSAPAYTQAIYQRFLKNYATKYQAIEKDFPQDYQGDYRRVKINSENLADVFHIGTNYFVIRNPEEVRYEVIYVNDYYRVKGKDNTHGATVGLYQARSGNRYMLFDGTLYKKI